MNAVASGVFGGTWAVISGWSAAPGDAARTVQPGVVRGLPPHVILMHSARFYLPLHLHSLARLLVERRGPLQDLGVQVAAAIGQREEPSDVVAFILMAPGSGTGRSTPQARRISGLSPDHAP